MGSDLKKWLLAALFTAMVMVATMLTQIPVGGTGAYIHAADGIIFACSLVLGIPYAAFAAGIGSMFADLFIGSSIYMIASLLIKGSIGAVAAWMFQRHKGVFTQILIMTVAMLWMTAGYFIWEMLVLGLSPAVAGYQALLNLIQAAFGVLSGLVFIRVIKRIWPEYR